MVDWTMVGPGGAVGNGLAIVLVSLTAVVLIIALIRLYARKFLVDHYLNQYRAIAIVLCFIAIINLLKHVGVITEMITGWITYIGLLLVSWFVFLMSK